MKMHPLSNVKLGLDIFNTFSKFVPKIILRPTRIDKQLLSYKFSSTPTFDFQLSFGRFWAFWVVFGLFGSSRAYFVVQVRSENYFLGLLT